MSDSRIIIVGLLAICLIIMLKPLPEVMSPKDILMFVLGTLAGYMRREPQYQTPPPPLPSPTTTETAGDTQELKEKA